MKLKWLPLIFENLLFVKGTLPSPRDDLYNSMNDLKVGSCLLVLRDRVVSEVSSFVSDPELKIKVLVCKTN